MRILTIVICIAFSLSAYAEQFTVFEKDGFFGIKDQTGQVTVPPVYEKLGWSDGSAEVRNGVIGYREGRLWGLISARNKALTEQKFYTITPLNEQFIKASVKGKFSNQLFHGLLDLQGKIVVSFHYFSIDVLDEHLLVSEYESNRRRYGVVTFSNQKLLPVKYVEIEQSHGFYIANTGDFKKDLYGSNGNLILPGLDSMAYEKGWKCFQDGYAGFVEPNGSIQYDLQYKNFEIEDEILFPIPFPTWKIFEDLNEIFQVSADSIVKNDKGLWVAYLNGSHHLTLVDSVTIGKEYVLKDASEDRLVLMHSKTRQWSLFDHSGNQILTAADSIFLNASHVWASYQNLWTLYDLSGKKILRYGFEEVNLGVSNQYAVKLNGHWGLIDRFGGELASFKYDSIVSTKGAYQVYYLNRWGILDEYGVWKVRPEFAEVFVFDYLNIGRIGQGYSVYQGNEFRFKTAGKPLRQLGDYLLIQDIDGGQGLLNQYGELVVDPVYDSILYWHEYFELRRNGFSEVIAEDGNVIFSSDHQIQKVGGFGNDYFLVKKNDRWGFADDKGRLRISNRYEHARVFSDEMAAVKLRGRWAFIDKEENLKVQPYYDEVELFKDGLSIVTTKELKGLIDKSGNEVIDVTWRNIERLSTGNYAVTNTVGKVGLVDGRGSFILRPAYDSLQDFGDSVIVSQNGKFGLLDYSGRQLFKIQQKEIKISGDYTLVKY